MEYQLMEAQEALIEPHYREGLEGYLNGGELNKWTKLLGWQMGTGKTPGSLTLCKQVRDALMAASDPRGELPILVICPAAVRTQWLHECRRWAGIDMALWGDDISSIQRLVTLKGVAVVKAIMAQMGCAIALDTTTPAKRKQALKLVDEVSPHFLIMGYELSVIHQQWLQERDWLGLIVDEAHAIKNPGALRSRAAMSIEAHFCLLLTGTPVDNRPPDLYNLLKRLDPGAAYIRRTGKRAAPAMQKCPLITVNRALQAALKVRWQYDGGYRDQHLALAKVREKAKVAFRGLPVDIHNLPQVPKHCYSCRYWHGTEYTGYCEFDGNSKGKLPVATRYRKESPYWGSRASFDNTYAVWADAWGRRQFVRARNELMLNRKLYEDGWATRLLRSEVMDVDSPTYQYVELDLLPDQQVLYDLVRQGVLERINALGKLDEVHIKSHLALMGHLERCSAATPYDFYMGIERNKPEWMREVHWQTSKRGAKQEWVMNFLDSLDGDKAVVFTRWRTVSDPLYEALEEKGYQPLIIRGAMKREDRDRNQHLFNTAPERKVIIVTTAGFEGIDLQAKSLGPEHMIHGIFMDVGWRPKDVTQPMARILRMGLRAKPWFWFLKGNGTIDEYKVNKLREKQQYIDRIVEGKSTGALDLFTINSKAQLLEML